MIVSRRSLLSFSLSGVMSKGAMNTSPYREGRSVMIDRTPRNQSHLPFVVSQGTAHFLAHPRPVNQRSYTDSIIVRRGVARWGGEGASA
jgi:hypothetical protein